MKKQDESLSLTIAPKIATALTYAFGLQCSNDIMVMALNPNYGQEHIIGYIQWYKYRKGQGLPTDFALWEKEVAVTETGAPSPRHTNAKKED